MGLEFNPADIARDVMAMTHGKWLAIPAILLLVCVLLGTFLAVAHLGFLNISPDSRGILPVRWAVDQDWFGWATFGALVLVVALWVSMFLLVAAKGPSSAAVLPRPKFFLSTPTCDTVADRFRFQATLMIDTPFPIPKVAVVAESRTVSALEFFSRGNFLTLVERNHREGGHYAAITNAAGEYQLRIYTIEREEVEVTVLLGEDEVVIRKSFRPQ